MGTWFVKVTLAGAADDEQCLKIARRAGSVYVDRRRERTEVDTHLSADDAGQAVADGLRAVHADADHAGFRGAVVAVQAQSTADRLLDLAAEGVPVPPDGAYEEVAGGAAPV